MIPISSVLPLTVYPPTGWLVDFQISPRAAMTSTRIYSTATALILPIIEPFKEADNLNCSFVSRV
jgi:hypothetical protein